MITADRRETNYLSANDTWTVCWPCEVESDLILQSVSCNCSCQSIGMSANDLLPRPWITVQSLARTAVLWRRQFDCYNCCNLESFYKEKHWKVWANSAAMEKNSFCFCPGDILEAETYRNYSVNHRSGGGAAIITHWLFNFKPSKLKESHNVALVWRTIMLIFSNLPQAQFSAT